MSLVFTFSPENDNFGSKKSYVDFTGDLTWQMLVSVFNFSGGGRSFAIYMFE